MCNVAKLVLVTLAFVICVDASAATTASAVEPLFATESLKALLFTGTGGAVTLRSEQLGVVGTITCEKNSIHGRALHASALARELHMEFKGKCEQTVGSSKGTCTEPIKPLLSYGELGLLNGNVFLLVAPEKGATLFVEVKCTNGNTTFTGAVIGEFPEIGRDGTSQYGLLREALLLSFKAKGTTQEPEEIELLGASMKNLKNVSLKAEGFFGGKASQETKELLLFTGKAGLQSATLLSFNPPNEARFTKAETKPVEVRNNQWLLAIKLIESKLNITTYFKVAKDNCKNETLAPWFAIAGKLVCTVEIEAPAPFKAGESAILTVQTESGNQSYDVKS